MHKEEEHLKWLKEVVEGGAKSLRQSLDAYWPTFGSTGAHERNVAIHIGSAFIRHGYSVFGEAHANGSANQRYDLVAISPDLEHLVAAEFKLLWKWGAAAAMTEDLTRLLDFRPVVRSSVPDHSRLPRFGVLAALAYKHDFIAPFDPGVDADKRKLEVVEDLPTGALTGAHKLSDAYGKTPDEIHDGLWLVYAIFPMGCSSRH